MKLFLMLTLTATLFAAQSLATVGTTAATTVGTIAAAQLSGQTAFAGLPLTLYLLGNALGAFPAAFVLYQSAIFLSAAMPENAVWLWKYPGAVRSLKGRRRSSDSPCASGTQSGRAGSPWAASVSE